MERRCKHLACGKPLPDRLDIDCFLHTLAFTPHPEFGRIPFWSIVEERLPGPNRVRVILCMDPLVMEAMNCRSTFILVRHLKAVCTELMPLLSSPFLSTEDVLYIQVKKKVQEFLGTLHVKPVDPNQCEK